MFLQLLLASFKPFGNKMRINVYLALQCVFLLLLSQLQPTESFAIFSAIMSVISFSGKWTLTAFTGFLGFHGSEMLISLMKGDRDKFADLHNEMQRGFEKLNDQIATSSETIVNRLSHQIHASAEFHRIFQRIEDYTRTISIQFKDLQQLLQGEFRNDTLYRKVDYLTSSTENTVMSAMYSLDSIINDGVISSQLSKGTIMTIIDYMNALHDVKHCKSITAPAEVMYVFLHHLTMVHLKGMVTIQEAFNLLAKISDKTEDYYVKEYHRVENETAKHISNLLQHMDQLQLLSPYSFACMPQSYIEHKNYERFEKFLPVYLTNEYGLEHYYKTRREHLTMYCSETCPWYDIATFYPNPKRHVRLNHIHRCRGMVHNCKLAENLAEQVCMQPSNATQLYTKHEDGCHVSAVAIKTRYEWYQCETCQCACDTHVGQNYIYTAPIMAKPNAVVTGVRFEKRNKALMLNIETANALPFAFASNADAHWMKDPPEEWASKNSDKYFKLPHWCRHFALTDVRVPHDQVVVGVQLYPVPGKRCALNLRVFGRQINMLNGSFTNEGIVSYSTKIDNATEVIDVTDLLSGVDEKAQKITTAEKGPKLIKLSNSALGDNLGQNTLPYFDTQPVTASPKMMQAGVGFYYRTTEKYAGYVAPRLIAFNTMDYLNAIEKKPYVVKEQLTHDAEASKILAKRSKLDRKV